MQDFMAGKVPPDGPAFIEIEKFKRLVISRDFTKARLYLKEREQIAKELDLSSDYFELEPLIAVALRSVLTEALSSPASTVFKPRRPQRDGDVIVGFDGLQIQIFLNADQSIKRVKLNFLETERLQYLYPPSTTSTATTEGPRMTHAPTSPLRIISHQSPLAPPKVQPPVEPVDFGDLELPEVVREEFDRLNQAYPGHHNYLQQAAILLWSHPEFTDSRGLGWYFGKVEKRVRLDGIIGVEGAVRELEHDIARYELTREAFNTSVTSFSSSVPETLMPMAPIPEVVDVDGIRSILKDWGWTPSRIRGDHEIFVYPGAERNIVVSRTHTNGLLAFAKSKLRLAWQYKWNADTKQSAGKVAH